MCLFSIKKEEDEDFEVSRRVYQREYRSAPSRRTSRVASVRSSHSVRSSEPTIINIPPPPPVAIPPPSGKVLPAPQPVPHFEAPRPPPPPDVQYVHVSPRSSVSDHEDYVYERRERRYERDVEPQYYEYRHVSAPEEPRHRPRRERSRSRSRARSRYDNEYDDYDRTNVKVTRRRYD